MQSAPQNPWPVDTPIRLCALRVEFVEDHISGTTGTGRMGSGFDSSLTIDPLPHDKVYFEDHLSFMRHYFETVSGGRVTFERMDVYPTASDSVYQLDYPMWHYNYNADDALLDRRLVELFVHSTAKATEVDFTLYDAILVFHAGTGKDFNLGYDATPFDIPSAYISERDIAAYSDDVAVPAGVTRGLILPESENQQEALDFGVELSLNGIAVKLFGNWLGMPDLFDTRTGRSGIGRWGMMDQGSGNVNALVPARPDAWSRAFMGWEIPEIIVPSGGGDTIRVARPGNTEAPRIVKIPVTLDEYYLVENRDADADSIGFVELRDRAGRRMRIDQFGTISVEDGFRVAVSASHFDFGIPGSGLLIWRIDEAVIAAGLADNSVNTDIDHRGVALVEADGAQDIGQLYGFASAGAGAELGIQEDAWYRDNQAHRAANGDAFVVRFNDRTFPSARFYDGAYTRLEFADFSDVLPVMQFTVRTAGMQSGFPLRVGADPQWVIASSSDQMDFRLFIQSGDSLFAADSTGTINFVAEVDSGLHLATKIPPVDLDGDGYPESLLHGRGIGLIEWTADGYIVRQALFAVEATLVLPAADADAGYILAFPNPFAAPDQNFTLQLFNTDCQGVDSLSVFMQPGIAGNVVNVESLPSSQFVCVIPGEAVSISTGSGRLQESWRIADSRIAGYAAVLAEPERRLIFLGGYGYVHADDGVMVCAEPDCIAPQEDWDGDGVPDGGGAFGRREVARENVPLTNPKTTVIADLDASGDADLWRFGPRAAANNREPFTRCFAQDHFGISNEGFPLATSAHDPRRLARWFGSNDLHFVAVVDAGDYSLISVNRVVPARNGTRFAYAEPASIINVGTLRPQVHQRGDWVYCWPNPTADVSRIRLTFAEAASAEVRLFDLAGRLVTTLTGSSSMAGPFEIEWDVSRIESGVYIGQVRAEGAGFAREAQIKIAVVK